MNRTSRASIAIVFIGIMMFSGISICQNIIKGAHLDLTENKIYTISAGSKAIINKLRQPITLKLYYTKTATMKAPDQMRFFNDYFNFVKSLLEKYVSYSQGMISLQIIDPRPFSDEEVDALRYGLKKIPMSENENFFFGLVLQTQFGVTKPIAFFSPDRQDFIEYDISSLIDKVITREKQKVGVLSSLPVMGQQVSSYMARMMMMQGQEPTPAWGIIQQLEEKYDVTKIDSETEDINNIDILLVIHPKELSEKTQFSIDQFVLRGGRTIVCVDPYCIADQAEQPMGQMQKPHKSSSNLKNLMQRWGLEMPELQFAGDRQLALTARLSIQQRPEKIIGFLGLNKNSFNQDNILTANLNQVRTLFAGVLKKRSLADSNDITIQTTPLVSTTAKGNSWSVSSPYELMMPNPSMLMNRFTEGDKPVYMGYLVTGKFKSAFPDGIEIKDKSDPNSEPRHISGLRKANTDCAVVVYSDVDFITDMLSYRRLPLGLGQTPAGDNAALLMNTIDYLTGSSDLISIRTRGDFKRPFAVVDRIEAQAEKGTAEQENRINAEIAGFREELNKLVSSANAEQQKVIGSSILEKRKELELKMRKAQRRLREVKKKEREKIEQLGSTLRNLNTLPGPLLVLILAVVIGLRRRSKRKHYISHKSDA